MTSLPNFDWQTVAMLLIVILAALYLLWRWLPRSVARRLGFNKLGVKPVPACGACSDCAGCPAARGGLRPPVRR